jgi:protein-S-isoprenylcysteine O-methyltransferase Ste14
VSGWCSPLQDSCAGVRRGYVFRTLFTTGVILWTGKLVWLLALGVIVPLQVMRAKKEAQVLEGKFGDAYRAYRAKSWF